MKYPTIVIDDSSIQRLTTTFLIKNNPHLELVGEYANPYEGIKAIYDTKATVVFLDVLMNDINAFELLDSIEIGATIIMNSTWSKFEKSAVHYNVQHFLKKPISKQQFESVVEKAVNNLQSNQHPIAQRTNFLESFQSASL
ncbi:response regulator [uncultured Croceitalea sp.]|uniref:LytR/AlgR family response regulator transcription factor n=1 Tax=uncultured Croceitalea sp. TaxID=1798908 RepID=UPI003306044D